MRRLLVAGSFAGKREVAQWPTLCCDKCGSYKSYHDMYRSSTPKSTGICILSLADGVAGDRHYHKEEDWLKLFPSSWVNHVDLEN
jgi:hypothetical protein